MFRLLRASDEEINEFLLAAQEVPVSTPQLLSLTNGLTETRPWGFAHDLSRSEIGRGPQAFAAARKALERWDHFDLGWVRIANPMPAITAGELVAVEACTARLWSINLSRIVEVLDSPTCFGFMYATTALHVEEGQERFVLEFDPESGTVSYVIEAVSRPRNTLARIGYPFTRAMQHRFVRSSHARLKRSLLGL